MLIVRAIRHEDAFPQSTSKKELRTTSSENYPSICNFCCCVRACVDKNPPCPTMSIMPYKISSSFSSDAFTHTIIMRNVIQLSAAFWRVFLNRSGVDTHSVDCWSPTRRWQGYGCYDQSLASGFIMGHDDKHTWYLACSRGSRKSRPRVRR